MNCTSRATSSAAVVPVGSTATAPQLSTPAAATRSGTGRARTMTLKQQQNVAQQAEKEDSAQKQAYTEALRAQQKHEEINGFNKEKNNLSSIDVDDTLGPESEDDETLENMLFSSITVVPRPVQHSRNAPKPSDQASLDMIHVGTLPMNKKQGPVLIHRFTGPSKKYPTQDKYLVTPSAPQTLLVRNTPIGPYTPHIQAVYGCPDGSSYHSHIHVPEAEFGTAPTGLHFAEPIVYEYPNAHPDLENFPCSAAHTGQDCVAPQQATPSLEVCDERGIRVELDEKIFKLIGACASQTRGQLKTTSKPYVLPSYSIDGSTGKCDICDWVEHLLDSARFIYKARFTDPEAKTGIFRASILQVIINKMWFRNKDDEGVIHPEFLEDDMLALPTLALALTIVENNLDDSDDEWVTGEQSDVPFTMAAYKSKYQAHLQQLTDFARKMKEAEIIPQLCRHMLKAARKHACIEDATGVGSTNELADADIEAAKREWEDLVLSDDK
ncbi:unnamed protein product [Cyclocybe aegerita]|uniref:DUF6532 domain-containing protein n=1 Tax=Cyclocybe aegerita TaxID=1973307 RepID=A0A8S0W0J9_CYCAE|nr:unnamed protein product [Cyclocybe aegerita]